MHEQYVLVEEVGGWREQRATTKNLGSQEMLIERGATAQQVALRSTLAPSAFVSQSLSTET